LSVGAGPSWSVRVVICVKHRSTSAPACLLVNSVRASPVAMFIPANRSMGPARRSQVQPDPVQTVRLSHCVFADPDPFGHRAGSPPGGAIRGPLVTGRSQHPLRPGPPVTMASGPVPVAITQTPAGPARRTGLAARAPHQCAVQRRAISSLDAPSAANDNAVDRTAARHRSEGRAGHPSQLHPLTIGYDKSCRRRDEAPASCEPHHFTDRTPVSATRPVPGTLSRSSTT